MRPFLVLAAILLWPPLVTAREAIGVRVGDHPTHGRIVFDWPSPPPYRLEHRGDRALLRFGAADPVDLAGARRPPRNVLGVAATEGGVEIALRPGSGVRHFRHGPWVVVDLLDPPDAGESRPRPMPEPAGAGPIAEAPPASAPPARAHPSGPPGAAPASHPAPAPAPTQPVAVPHPAARPVRLIGAPGEHRGALLPFGPEVGAAILLRGGMAVAVFDTSQPLDLTALRRDPVLGTMTAAVLPNATMVTLALAPPAVLRARRKDGAWVLEAVRADGAREGGPERPLGAEAAAEGLLTRAAAPGKVIGIADPQTGLPLLAGTVREAGQAVRAARRFPEADLPATELGMAVLARSDQLALRPVAEGFLLTRPGSQPLALGPAAGMSPGTTALTRVFAIPALPATELVERHRAETVAIAAAAPLTRLALRRAAAETLLALGLPQEAQAVLTLALGEHPDAPGDPVMAALTGVSALLSGRPGDAAGLEQAALPESDELLLWRSLLMASRGSFHAAAPGLAATLPLALGYPERLRARILPMLAHALAEAEHREGLSRLLAAVPEGIALSLARARLAELEGEVEEALAGYDAVAGGPDRLLRARALRHGVELRLATGRMDSEKAAESLEAALFAWRGDGHELGVRLRLAELRRAASDARGAMTLLRESEVLFPEAGAALRPPLRAAFLDALRQETPLGAAALFDAYPELLPPDAEGEAAAALLAERLLSLDLPDRAGTLLRRAAEAMPREQRASLGLRLARLRLSTGDAEAVLATLRETDAADLPQALSHERKVLAARAVARNGSPAEAVAMLQALGPAGAEPLAELLIEARDWAGAARMLAVHLRAVVPAEPAAVAPAHRHLLLRQAALLALAGDGAALAELGAEFGPRLHGGPLAEPFAALTADPLRGLADLPRLQQELQLFRSLPGLREPLRAASLAAR